MTLQGFLAVLSVMAVAGCQAPRPLVATKNSTKLRAVIDGSIRPGDTLAEVQADLTALEVDPIDQEITPGPTGPRLRAWLWGPGGPWASSDPDDFFDWVEVLFRFDAAERLEGYDISRRSVWVRSMRYTVDVRHDPQVRPRPEDRKD
jgi:hypothetical protein